MFTLKMGTPVPVCGVRLQVLENLQCV